MSAWGDEPPVIGQWQGPPTSDDPGRLAAQDLLNQVGSYLRSDQRTPAQVERARQVSEILHRPYPIEIECIPEVCLPPGQRGRWRLSMPDWESTGYPCAVTERRLRMAIARFNLLRRQWVEAALDNGRPIPPPVDVVGHAGVFHGGWVTRRVVDEIHGALAQQVGEAQKLHRGRETATRLHARVKWHKDRAQAKLREAEQLKRLLGGVAPDVLEAWRRVKAGTLEVADPGDPGALMWAANRARYAATWRTEPVVAPGPDLPPA